MYNCLLFVCDWSVLLLDMVLLFDNFPNHVSKTCTCMLKCKLGMKFVCIISSAPFKKIYSHEISLERLMDLLKKRHPKIREKSFVCLFVLRFNIPVNNFSVTSGRSHYFLGIPVLTITLGGLCLAQRHNMVPSGWIKPRTSGFRARCSITTPLCSPEKILCR